MYLRSKDNNLYDSSDTTEMGDLMAGTEKKRCAWAENDALMQAYHDEEWGVPEHDSRALWELLMLEGFQAGLLRGLIVL